MIFGFTSGNLLTAHTAVIAVSLVTYAAISLTRRQRRHPSAALGWVLLLLLAPYVGLPLFLMFGSRKTARAQRKARPRVHDTFAAMHGPGARMRALALGMGLPGAVESEGLVIHEDGAMALERLKALVLSARRTLDVSTFLLGRDALGDELVQLLAQRAREGVRVRFMVDGIGRYLGGAPRLRPLRLAGVDVGLFIRPWSSPLRGRVNLRNHRKMAVADGEWLWSGGRNLAAEYFVGGAGPAGTRIEPWTDLSFDLRGPLAAQAAEQFERDWAVGTGGAPPIPAATPPSPERPGVPLVQLLPSGPDQADDTLYELLVDACFNAEQRIVAVTPYFVPDPALLMALGLAARRGVTIDLILPRRSNHRLADFARPAAVRDLLDCGARVWLVPSMLHAKLFVFDQTVALAGSLNLDARSLFLNYEMMVAFYDGDAIARYTAWADAVRAGAARLEHKRVGALREVGEGLLRWLTFQL